MGDPTVTTEQVLAYYDRDPEKLASALLRVGAELAAAEKRAEEGSAEALKITEAYEEALIRLRTDLARLQPLVDAARAYARDSGALGNRKAREDLLNTAFDLFAEEVRRG